MPMPRAHAAAASAPIPDRPAVTTVRNRFSGPVSCVPRMVGAWTKPARLRSGSSIGSSRMQILSRQLYQSFNEERWLLLRDFRTGRVFVRHEANLRSGGQVTDAEIGDFLNQGGIGPEKLELFRLIEVWSRMPRAPRPALRTPDSLLPHQVRRAFRSTCGGVQIGSGLLSISSRTHSSPSRSGMARSLNALASPRSANGRLRQRSLGFLHQAA